MALQRKDRIDLSIPRLVGVAWDAAANIVERYLIRILEVLEDQHVVLPTEDQGPDPENGALLFDGSALHIAIDGDYHQIYPTDASITSSTEGDVLACDFTQHTEDIKWAQVDCDADDSTDLFSATPGKRNCIVYLEVCNADATDSNDFHIILEGDATKYFRKRIIQEGIVVQNFTRANAISGVGKKISAVVGALASGDMYVTIGYLELDEV